MNDVGLVNYGPAKHNVDLRDIPMATLKPDEVLLEVQAVGVCGSDLHMWQATQSWQVNYPVVLGHEYGGIVRKVGKNVTDWNPGDRAVGETAAVIDPKGAMTRRGLYNLDPSRKGFGADIDGAMRQFIPVPQRICHHLPDNIPFEHAALTEPCCVSYNAVVVNSDVRTGDRVAVLGPGPIGILCGIMANLQGAEVTLVGLPQDTIRLEVARQYGLHTLIGNPTEWAMSPDGLGIDGVVDATGVSGALETALNIVRPAGWITKVGWGPEPIEFSIDPLVKKNIRLQGSFSHNWPIWERVLSMLATGQLDVAPIIGGTWQLGQWQEAFETMHDCKIVKAVLRP